jgi:phage protein D
MALSAAIAVDGSVDQSLAVATWIEVYEHLGRPTDYRIRFEVEIGSSDFDQLTDARLDVGSELSIMVPDPAGSQCLVKGPVGAQRIHFEHGGSGSYVEVGGSDTSITMDREAKSTVWTDVTDSDAVTSILSGAGLVPDIESTSAGHYETKHVMVQRESDLSFVRRLARRNGFAFWVTCDGFGVQTAHFKRLPVDAASSATLKINATTPTVDRLDVRWDVERPTSIAGTQVDLSSLEDIDGAKSDAPLSSLGDQDLAAITGDTRSIFLAAPVDDAGDLQARSTGALVDSYFFVKATGETRLDLVGTPIRAHTVVELQGAGSRHSGKYLVGGVRHTIDSDSYRMELELLRNGWGG